MVRVVLRGCGRRWGSGFSGRTLLATFRCRGFRFGSPPNTTGVGLPGPVLILRLTAITAVSGWVVPAWTIFSGTCRSRLVIARVSFLPQSRASRRHDTLTPIKGVTPNRLHFEVAEAARLLHARQQI